MPGHPIGSRVQGERLLSAKRGRGRFVTVTAEFIALAGGSTAVSAAEQRRYRQLDLGQRADGVICCQRYPIAPKKVGPL